MSNNKTRMISGQLDAEIENMIIKIEDLFGIKIKKIQASKIIAYKSKNYKLHLDAKKLREILGEN